MLSKLRKFIKENQMIQPGDTVICAVSGGLDSISLLFAFYLLKEQMHISLEAAHFNHHLRGKESLRDENFVKDFCEHYGIPLHLGESYVTPGKKGLEAAAREARYSFFATLSGKIATAHTADDNAETILMHLIRGTGLKGLGGITPVQGRLIRPLLLVTRQELESFSQEWNLAHVEDSSNQTDTFLRNRVRHRIMPLLTEENPKLSENLSKMALGLRLDAQWLEDMALYEELPCVSELLAMPKARCIRMIDQFLKVAGIPEPEAVHIHAVYNLLSSPKPSAQLHLPGGIRIARSYDCLKVIKEQGQLEPKELSCPGEIVFGNYRMIASYQKNSDDSIAVQPKGALFVRGRQTGDCMTLTGGTKSLKKLYIDRKIPADQRQILPILVDDMGILAVAEFGANLSRYEKEQRTVYIDFLRIDNKGECV